jgi:hypothetical protein
LRIEAYNKSALNFLTDYLIDKIISSNCENLSLMSMQTALNAVDMLDLPISTYVKKCLKSNLAFLTKKDLLNLVNIDEANKLIIDFVFEISKHASELEKIKSEFEEKYEPRIENLEKKISAEKDFAIGLKSFIKNFFSNLKSYISAKHENRKEIKRYGYE